MIRRLGDLGFDNVSEAEVGGRYPDIIARYKSEKFVIQVRIDGERVRQDLLRDAYVAARRADTMNVVTMVYPHEVRRRLPDELTLRSLALQSAVVSDVFTSYLTSEIKDTAENVFLRIKEAVDQGTKTTDIELAVHQLSQEVESVAMTLRRIAGPEIEPALQSVVGRFDLFMALGNQTPEETRVGAIDLMAYLLLDQLLFYHIYSERTGDVDPLPASITSLRDLTRVFTELRRIDFAPVYSIELSESLPARDQELVNALNSLLVKMRLIRPENVELDLLGRFFHELLPPKTRDILAAFYTHPISGEILAGLSVGMGAATVMDLACGSGTLLVAAYRRKLKLLGQDRTARIHHKILREITGIDIMPFAAHLTAINLSVQSARQKSNYLRVSVNDSLELVPNQSLKPFSRQLQSTLFGLTSQVRSSGVIGLSGRASSFVVAPVDVIIMNPPFSDREKMPEDFRDKLNARLGSAEIRRRIQRLRDVVGGGPNLWAYFIALSNNFLKDEGVLGAILPTNILRGRTTQAVRDLILTAYETQYLLRTCKDYGFTEGSELRDLMLIARKKQPADDSLTCMVWIKDSIRSLTVEKAGELVTTIARIQPRQEVESEFYDATWLSHGELMANRVNLTPLVSYSSLRNQKTFTGFLRRLKGNETGLLTQLPPEVFFEGFHTSPKGRSQALCLTNPISQERLEHALMVITSIDGAQVRAQFDGTGITIPRSGLLPALRSLTSVRKMDIAGIEDYLAISAYPEFRRVAQLASWRGDMDWASVMREAETRLTQLAIPLKFNFYSPNFHLFGFYRDEPYVPFDFLKGIRVPSAEDARILCLFFNSTVFISQAFTHREETQVRFPKLREEDLVLLDILDVRKLSSKDRSMMLNTFDRIRGVEFPSLTQQLETRHEARLALDSSLLEILGFADDEVAKTLPLLYDALVQEFKATRGLRMREFVEY